jgi:hypothetical protein
MASYCVEPQGTRVVVRYDLQNENHCTDGKSAYGDSIECANCKWRTPSIFASHDALKTAVSDLENTILDTSNGLWLVKIAAGVEVGQEERKSWEMAVGGHSFAHYVYSRDGNQFFSVYAPRSAVDSIRSLDVVDDVIAVPPEMKQSPELSVLLEETQTSNITGTVDLIVILASFHSSSIADAARVAKAWQDLLGDFGALVSAHGDDTISIKGVPRVYLIDVVAFLSADPRVHWIEPVPMFKNFNNYAKGVTQSNNINSVPIHAQGIRGENIVVGVGDSGLDYMSNYFYDPAVPVSVANGGTFTSDTHRKIAQYVAYADNKAGELNSHGTHVQGTIAGDTISSASGASAYNGMAYKARLAFFDIGVAGQQYLNVPPSIYSDLFPAAYSRGARLHSNSWGSSTNTYNVNARDVDRYQWEHQDFLVIIAAGNEGDSGASTIGTPATSKNGVAVGATQHNINSESDGNCAEPSSALPCENNMAHFSSRGPMFDNRIAPTVSAPGFSIRSVQGQVNPTTPHDFLTMMAGTSMATPVTSGSSALIQQYFQEGWYPSGSKTSVDGFKPMGALIKAVLMNSATYMKGQVSGVSLTLEPSNSQGFGRIRLDSALGFSASTFSLAVFGDFGNMKQLSTGGVHTYTFKVTSTARSFKVTLAYSDYPAATSASVAIVNDLDLQVTTPSGAIVYPNGLTAKDTINNIEQIEIKTASTASTPALATGTYVVKVSGTRVAQGPQPYALVVTGIFDKTSDLYPGKAPTVTVSSGVVTTTTTSLTIAGSRFSPNTAGNAVTLSCGTATVVTASIAQLTLSVNLAGCVAGPLTATVTANGFKSASAQVAVVGTSTPTNPCTGVTCPAYDQCSNAGVCQVVGTVGSCLYTPKTDGSACNDNDPGTSNDVCHAGVCAGVSQCTLTGPCVAIDQCHTAGVCTAGLCSNPVKNNQATCDDGLSSTDHDKCTNGVCGGTPVTPGPPSGSVAWINLYVNKSIPLTTTADQTSFLTKLGALIGVPGSVFTMWSIDRTPVTYNVATIQLHDDSSIGIRAQDVALLLSGSSDGLTTVGVISASGYGSNNTGRKAPVSNIVAGAIILVAIVVVTAMAFYVNRLRKVYKTALLATKTPAPASQPCSSPVSLSIQPPSQVEPSQVEPAKVPMSSPSSAPKLPPRPAPKLPAGWSEEKSPEGEIYYWHAETGNSTWDRPTSPSPSP